MKKTQANLIKHKSRNGVSVIILIFSLFAIIGLAALVLDLGLIINQRHELQKAVESSALLAASEYELYESDRRTADDFRLHFPDDSKITDTGTGIGTVYYKALKDYNQFLSVGTDLSPTVSFNKDSRAVLVEANARFPTYFLSIIGISKIQIEAKAAAVNIPAYLSGNFPKPSGSIVNGVDTSVSPEVRDTEIKPPLGRDTSGGVHPTGTVYNQNTDFDNIYGRPDGISLSLGPGGHVLIRLPSTIYDGKGVDFAVYERGNAEGYFLYAGVDNDPANPYIDAANPGGGINWINVSCTGIPLYARMDNDEPIGAYETDVYINNNSSETAYKFYGSGFFDLGARCEDSSGTVFYDGTDTSASPRINNVKYLKIIDDNIEDGFFLQPRLNFGTHPAISNLNTEHAIPMIIPGEHSSITPGADIDAIEIRHHARLISTSDFSTDTDGDGLIDVVERIHGLDPNLSDTDGDGYDDITELEGDEPETVYGYDDTPQYESEGSQDDVQTLYKEYPLEDYHPPVIIIKP